MSPMTSATGPAASTRTSIVQVELQGAHFALLARLVGYGRSGRSGMVRCLTGQLKWMHGAAAAA
eukprot:1621977-Prymnesium_polylepis.1